MPVPTTIRFADDVQDALIACAEQDNSSVSDVIQKAVHAYLAKRAATSERMDAEAHLLDIISERAKVIAKTDWTKDVTRDLFVWIQNNHHKDYELAIGPNGAQTYRVNPLLAKRFAVALDADYERDAKGNPAKAFLPRNANELIQSYTLLKKRT